MKTAKYALLAAVLLAAAALQAQTVGTWKSYPAYHEATLVTETPHAVYAVYDGSMLSYSTDDESIQTYSVQDGLNPAPIIFLQYCPDTKALLIVYEDSNMDIFLGRNQVYHLPDIKNNIYLTNKAINSVEVRGGNAYLATGFGIVVVDIQNREIRNTYRFDMNTTAACEWGEYLYAATEGGLIRARLSSNLTDRANWAAVAGAEGVHIDKMVLFQEHLILYDAQAQVVWWFSPEGGLRRFISDNLVRQLAVFNGRLTFVGYHFVIFYKDFDTSVGVIFDERIKAVSSVYSGGDYWVAWGDRGVLKVAIPPIEEGWTEYETLVSDIRVNSPKRNYAFRLKFSGDKLLVTGGDRGGNRLDRAGTFMIYDQGRWQSLDEQAVAQQTGLPCNDLIDMVEDPRSPGRYFVSSWGEGIYVFNQELELENRYSLHNSTLQPTSPDNTTVRVDGLIFDAQNNLYATNAGVTSGLSILSPDGRWSAHHYEHLVGIQPNRLLIARDGKKWINFFRIGSVGGPGVFVLDDTRGDPNETSDDGGDRVYHSEQFIDQQGRNAGATAYLCMAEDLSGVVWVGTDNGPITFSSADQVDRSECYRPVGTDEYGDGYYLLEGQKVNAIAVDGGNRKWIGTDGGGLFLVDQAEGQLNVQNFTTDNSLILSNTILSIAINGRTGEVFVGTSRGICSYQGDAIDGRADYSSVHAFPNPVFPRRNNQVVITGLMQNSRIKITDIAGNLIREATSNGGQYTWNCAGPGGGMVAAGIYLVFATLPDGREGVVTKVMVMR
jgi:hypothetical protein